MSFNTIISGSFRSRCNPDVYGLITFIPENVVVMSFEGQLVSHWEYQGSYRNGIRVTTTLNYISDGSQIMFRKRSLSFDHQVIIYLSEIAVGCYSGSYICLNPFDNGIISIPAKPTLVKAVVETI